MNDNQVSLSATSNLNILKIPQLIPYACAYVYSNGELYIYNQLCKKLFAIPDSESLKHCLLDFVSEQDKEKIESQLKSQTWPAEGMELKLKSPGGFEGRKLLLRKANVSFSNLPAMHLLIMEDITAHKELELLVREAISASEAGNRAKSNFLANISHELRTPLNGIFGLLNLLEMTELSLEQKNYVSMIQETSDNLLTVIQDVLDFNSIEEGSLELDKVPFDFMKIVDKIIDIFSPSARTKGIVLTQEFLWDNSVDVIGDSARIYKVLFSLMSNAIKFTRAGSVHIKLECLESNKQQISLKVSIQDTGIGIPEHKKNVLFDFFSQLDASTTREYGGMGLGLSLCRKFVNLMNSEIGFESIEGKGTNFWVLLKLPVCPTQRPLLNDQFSMPPVLFIKNINSGDNTSFTDQLRFWNVPVHIENSGQITAALISDVAFLPAASAAVLDIEKEEDLSQVYYFCEVVYNRFIWEKIPLFIYTYSDFFPALKSLLETGFVLFLKKPSSPSNLYNMLRRLTEDREALFSKQETENAAIVREPLKANILLVEDSSLTRHIVCEFLKKMGCRAEIAEDGPKALEKLKNHSFDLILVEGQMEQMNGILKKIRAALREKSVPIIIMTSHALNDKDINVRGSGINDFILKPVKAEVLYNTIKCWTSESEFSSLPVFDYQKVVDITDGDPEIIQKAIALFDEDLSRYIEALEKFIESRNEAQVERTAHTLKGSASYLGAERLRQIALTIELLSPQKKWNKIELYFSRFIIELNIFKKTLAETLSHKKDGGT